MGVHDFVAMYPGGEISECEEKYRIIDWAIPIFRTVHPYG